MSEMPAITASSYSSTALNMAALNHQGVAAGGAAPWQHALQHHEATKTIAQPAQGKPIMAAPTARRLVQVFIADPNENVPLADALLHSGEQKLTDLTDQELFFEIDIRTILATHNDKRAKMVNKAVKERTEYLEPARIRDLKMTVVSIATF